MKKKKSLYLILLITSILVMPACDQIDRDSISDQDLTSELDPVPAELSSDMVEIGTSIRDIDGAVQLHIPGGTFLQGSTEEGVEAGIELCRQYYQPCNRWFYEEEYPQYEVTLSPFVIDQHEVTNQQYRRCVEAGVCSEPLECKKGEPTYQDVDKADHPVVCVNWEEARSYCEWVGGRLPTEAEWEYASRGTESRTFPWGDEFIGSKLNYCDLNCNQSHADPGVDDGYGRTSPVGSYPEGKSWVGVEGLGGNVSEWVNDWHGDYGPESLKDPIGPDSGSDKVIKGCSWYFPPVYCRGANRGSVNPEVTMDYLGFRCVSNPNPTIDGMIQPGEWDQAVVEEFQDGSELHLIMNDENLYLGIRSKTPEMIAGNILLQRGDQILIMHTSAALGTGIYQMEGEEWHLVQGFNWCCRSTGEDESAKAERLAFLAEEGWLGSISFRGNPEELEYMIALTGEETALAVNIIKTSDPNVKIPWPASLEDGVITPTPGGLPESLTFTLEEWGKIEDYR